MTARTLFPEFAVAAGAVRFESGGRGELFRLEVDRALNGPADEVRFEIGRSGDGIVEAGDSLEVELGYEGELERVFTGTVTEVAHGASRLAVGALGSQHLLMKTRLDRSFLAQKADEMFQALAGEAGARVAETASSISLSFYLADSSVSAWEHCLRLAFHGGCDLYATVDGGLVFAPLPGPAAPRVLRFGAELIRADLTRAPALSMPRYHPESPASSGGEEPWLAKDNSGAIGEAGEGAVRPGYGPLMRTQEHAQVAADTDWLRISRRTDCGFVEITGRPDLDLGDAVQVDGLPGDEGGLYQVVALSHQFDFRRGFRTRARLAAAEEGA
jgi:phage protein D